MKKYFNLLLLGSLFLGCSQTNNVVVDTSMKTQQSQLNNYDPFSDEDNKEINFVDSKNMKYYKNGNIAHNNISSKINILLNGIFYQLNHKLRKRRIYVALVVDNQATNKNEILTAIQKYVINHKKYVLTTTDKDSLQAIKKTLKIEQDGIYTGNTQISLRHKSDVVLYINTIGQKVIAKILAKNGSFLASSSIKLNSNWVDVKVPTNDGGYKIFSVMIKPVSVREFKGKAKTSASISNVSFDQANNYCEKIGAGIMDLYVFEYARRKQLLQRPSLNINEEIIAPYDEDVDSMFYREGDNVESGDSSVVLFNWNHETYYATSNLYKSPNATFRCMKGGE